MENPTITYGRGWYPEEDDGLHRFRWMEKEAVCRLTDLYGGGLRTLALSARHLFNQSAPPSLEVLANGKTIGTKTIQPYFLSYLFFFEASGDVEFKFRLDADFKVPEDPRQLGIQVRYLDVFSPENIIKPYYGDGWFDKESEDLFAFHWMSKESRLLLPVMTVSNFKYMTLPIFSEYMDFSQVLAVHRNGRLLAEWPLIHKWNHYCVPLQPADTELPKGQSESTTGDIRFSVNKIFPLRYHPGDQRELGIRVGIPEFHNDEEQRANFLLFHRNAQRNFQEMIQGRIKLESFPLNLGIDLYAKCNIKPPCVYCLWDKMKILEGRNADVAVDKSTLETYGPFYKSARTLVSCSFGEPLLHPQIDEILESFARDRKIVEISTNGQAFTERTIRALAGKPIDLYISLDAATKETYAKIRNDRWDSIIPHLKRLNEERKKAGNLPKIFMVFMPMKVNRNDLEGYFRLCRDIDADFLVLRPLLHLWKPKIEADRGGYHFDYANEMLTRKELEEIVAMSEKFSRIYGVRLANQLNFGLLPDPHVGDEKTAEKKDGHERG